jgi:hypothetical protein
VVGFQYKQEADWFLGALKVRMEECGLALHPEKPRLIEFGRFAVSRRKERGLKGSPETFNVLASPTFAASISGKALSSYVSLSP